MEKWGESDDPQAILKNLRDPSTKGLGTVYLITLLYFISNGEWYVFDQYEMRALRTLLDRVKPGGEVICFNPPEKESKQFGEIGDKLIRPYKATVNGLFGDLLRGAERSEERIESFRKVDQALWVYDHRFERYAWNIFPAEAMECGMIGC